MLVGGDVGAAENQTISSISLPLIGSQNTHQPALGLGGPVDDAVSDLAVTQDSALIAPRNPLGTLSSHGSDQIVIYTVVPGDTPSSIADSFGITLNTLLWANNINNPNKINVGDQLVILPVSGVKYEIKKGDTIESIAKKFKGDAGEILSFNGLAFDENLEVESEIIIPDGEFEVPSAPTVPRVSRFGSLPEFAGYYMRPVAGGRNVRATKANPHGLHGFNGVDLANSCRQPIFASAEGTVIIARPSGWNGGYGKYVVIAHPNGTQTLYAHLNSILASVGQTIARGSQIAIVGNTGNSTGCHVHFEIRGAKNPF